MSSTFSDSTFTIDSMTSVASSVPDLDLGPSYMATWLSEELSDDRLDALYATSFHGYEEDFEDDGYYPDDESDTDYDSDMDEPFLKFTCYDSGLLIFENEEEGETIYTIPRTIRHDYAEDLDEPYIRNTDSMSVLYDSSRDNHTGRDLSHKSESCDSDVLITEEEEVGAPLQTLTQARTRSWGSSNDEDDLYMIFHPTERGVVVIEDEEGLRIFSSKTKRGIAAPSRPRTLTTTTWKSPVKTVREVEDSVAFYGRTRRNSFVGRAHACTDSVHSTQFWHPTHEPRITAVRYGY